MPFNIVRDEIARQSADVVVVPANPSLSIDGGAGLAVGRIAGISKLQAACYLAGPCDVGCAVATHAFDFPAKHIVHAVGPAWDGSAEAEALLAKTYSSALALSLELGARSIVLPLISSGSQGCPSDTSLHLALAGVKSLLSTNSDIDVNIVVFDTPATQAASDLFPGLEQYVDDAYAKDNENLFVGNATKALSMGEYSRGQAAPPYGFERDEASHRPNASSPKKRTRRFERWFRREKDTAEKTTPAESFTIPVESYSMPAGKYNAPTGCAAPTADLASAPRDLETLLDSIDAPFSTTLLAIIDERGLDDSEVYKRANLSRQHFSKIRSNPDYRPTKRTVLALAIALELDLEETEDLLRRAGLALSPASKADLIVEWFIMRSNYDIFAINEALYSYDQPILG